MKKKAPFPYELRLTAAILVFIAICLTFSGITFFSPAIEMQFFPALDRKAWGIVFFIVLFTFLFGRFYCSVICPFGILQDIIAFLSRKKSTVDKNRIKTRYAITAIAVTLLLSGHIAVFEILDPYSNFGRVISFFKNPAYITGLVVFCIILFLSIWKKRIFCTSICPVGTILGLCSKFTPNKMRISEKCVRCGRCTTVCPAGCVDPQEKKLDNERCVRCLKCSAVCPLNAVGFMKEQTGSTKFDLSRRNFLTGTFTTAAAVGAGAVLAEHFNVRKQTKTSFQRPICPPGATTPEEFASKCTNCQLCVNVCQGKVIHPKSKDFETVHLQYGTNYCLYECNNCCSVCPTGALSALTLAEKQKRRIAIAQIFQDKCIGCGTCARKCPQGAIKIEKINGKSKAVLSAQYCIGCGACFSACLLPEKAIRVVAVVIQSTAAKGIKER